MVSPVSSLPPETSRRSTPTLYRSTTLGSGKAALAYLIQVGMKAYEQAGIR